MSELVEIGLRIFDDWRTGSGALAATPGAESSCGVAEAGFDMPVATNDPQLPITLNNASASSIAFVTRTPAAPALKPSAPYLIALKYGTGSKAISGGMTPRALIRPFTRNWAAIEGGTPVSTTPPPTFHFL